MYLNCTIADYTITGLDIIGPGDLTPLLFPASRASISPSLGACCALPSPYPLVFAAVFVNQT